MITQKEILKEHFETRKNISNMEAQISYKIRALPRRISDLEEEGWTFDREWRKDGAGQRYIRYIVIEMGA